MRQRIINDDVLLQLLREGKSRKEAAQYFGVSPVAIHKKIKRLLPRPQSLDNLSLKEQRFVIAVAEGKSRTQAVMESFDVSSRASAKALQNQLMEKDDINTAIADLMQIYGLTRGYRINKLKSHVDHVDPNISLKALDTSFRLDGLYAAEKHIFAEIDVYGNQQRIAELNRQLEEIHRQREALTVDLKAELAELAAPGELDTEV